MLQIQTACQRSCWSDRSGGLTVSPDQHKVNSTLQDLLFKLCEAAAARTVRVKMDYCLWQCKQDALFASRKHDNIRPRITKQLIDNRENEMPHVRPFSALVEMWIKTNSTRIWTVSDAGGLWNDDSPQDEKHETVWKKLQLSDRSIL